MDRVIHGGNLYLDTINMRLALNECTLPSLARAKETLQAGGSFFSLAIPGAIEELEATFSLNGGHEYVRKHFGREPGDWSTLYWYERLRDIQKGENKGRIVMMKGLISEVAQPRVSGKKGEATVYKFGSIIQYTDIIDGREVHRMDIFNNQLIIDGVNYTEEHNAIIAA